MKHQKSGTGKGSRKRERRGSSVRLKQVTVLLALLGISISMGCIAPETERGMTIEDAMTIAQNSECVQEGRLTANYVHNGYTRTWWIDLDPFTPKEGCNPACVVYEDTKTAEINWRCTGAIPPVSDIANETCMTETGESMSLAEVLQIADASECVEVGVLTMNSSCNAATGTWWIDLEPYNEKEGCNPACVVNITTKTAEVNWRCTGLVP